MKVEIDSTNDIEALVASMRSSIEKSWNEIEFPDRPAGLYDPLRYVFSGKGKRIRPLLVLLGCYVSGGDWKKALPAAVSVEILHMFTLVHDDIMDNDTRRRGMPTLHVKWDLNIALLAGDALFTLALANLYKTSSDRLNEITELLANGMLRICEGQSLDYEFENRFDVSRDEYEDMVLRKTGVLLGLALKVGGILANAEEKTLKALQSFGEQIGVAFQIQDDLLEIISDERTMGKSLFSDIKAFKKTYPLLLAFEKMNHPERQTYIRTVRETEDSVELKKYVKRVFNEKGIIEECKEIVAQRIASANCLLSGFSDASRQPLQFIAETILQRNY